MRDLLHPNPPPVSFVDAEWSGEEFAALVRGAARELSERGVAEGDHVAVESDGVDVLAWFLGADLLGAAALVVEPSWVQRERDAVLSDAAPRTTVHGSPAPSTEPVLAAGDERTRFYLPTTSGSSGRPRVLARDRRSWLESFRAFTIGLDAADRVLVPATLSSSLFLFAALHALHEGRPLHLLKRWSAAETAERCTRDTVVHVVPAMLSALLSVWEHDEDLRRRCALRAVVSGGARVDAALAARLRRVLPGCRLVEYYGSAETSLVAIDHDRAGMLPVVEVEVHDARGDPLPAGEPGQLRVRSELVFDGHLEGGELRPREPGWVGVGDVATLQHDGTLVVRGRSSSTISSGGELVAAEEVEAALREAPEVLDVVVAGTPHERLGEIVTAVLEVGSERPPLSALRATARQALDPAKRPRRWLVTARIPRTASGKPARATVARQLREAALDAEVLA